ncbi:hypothetical protein INR49_024986, partial [Caranx melampygus]
MGTLRYTDAPAVWIQTPPSSPPQQQQQQHHHHRPILIPGTAPSGGNPLTKHRLAELSRPAHGRSSTMAEDLGVPLSYANNRSGARHPGCRLRGKRRGAEDPVSHSQTEAHMIVVGNCFSFLFNKYPGLGWNILKVVCWILAIITGLLAGKFIFHRQLFGQQLPLELLTSHDIQHWVQAAAYAAHGFKELIGGVEDVGVRWCDLVMDPHEHQSDDHDVVGREGDHKDEQGSSDEPQRLPPCPLGSSVPPAPRE